MQPQNLLSRSLVKRQVPSHCHQSINKHARIGSQRITSTKKTKTELNTYLSLSLEIADLKKSLNVAEQSVREIGSNQQRLRSNLSTIGNAANEQSLRQRYISELEKEEGTLANLRAEVKRHEAAIREAQSKQETILRTLSLVQDVKALSTA